MEAFKPSTQTTTAAAETREKASVEPQASSARSIANTVKEYVTYALGFLWTNPATTGRPLISERKQPKAVAEVADVTEAEAEAEADRRRFSAEQLASAAKKLKSPEEEFDPNATQKVQMRKRSFGRCRKSPREERVGILQAAKRRLKSNSRARKLDSRAARINPR